MTTRILKNTFPKVSVILPTYNSEKTIERAVNSVLHQSLTSFELLICDDASVDSTVDIIKNFTKTEDRLTLLQSKKNQGAGASRNMGLEVAKGEYIAFLDSDDEWLPNKLFTQVHYMDKLPTEVGICFCGAQIFKNKNNNKETIYHPSKSWEVNTYRKFVLDQIMFLTPTILFRRECLEKTGLMRTEMRRNQDGEFLLRLFKNYQLFVLPEIHVIIHLVVSNSKFVYERTKDAYPYWEMHINTLKNDLGRWPAFVFLCTRQTGLINLAIREKKWKEAIYWAKKRIKLGPILLPRELFFLIKSLASVAFNR